MATLNIGGKRVTVDDSFLTLSPEQQSSTVEEIAGSLAGGSAHPPAAPAAPAPAVPQGAPVGSGFTSGLVKGATLGFGDELMAAGMAPIEAGIAAYKGEDSDKGVFGRLAAGYDRALAKNRADDKAYATASPVASGAGEVIGSLMTGGALSKGGLTLLNGAKPTIGSMAGRGAAEGAAYGAVSGFGAGEGTEDRFKQAATGGTIGGVLGGTVGALAGRAAGRAAEKAVPSNDDLRAAATKAYQAADDAGVIFTPDAVSRLRNEVQTKLADLAYSPKLQPRVQAALEEIDRLQGQNVTLKGMDTLRQIAKDASDPMNKKSGMLAEEIASSIDDLIASPRASEVLAGNSEAGASALSEARNLWSRLRKSEMLDDALLRAERRADSTGSGGNVNNASRQNVRAILDSPKKSAGLSDGEKQVLEALVRGTPAQNAARLVGKLSPNGNGLMLALNAGAAGATGGASLAGTAVGSAAKAFADRGTSRAADIASAMIRNGGPIDPQQLSPQVQALLEAMVRAGAVEGPKAIGMTR